MGILRRVALPLALTAAAAPLPGAERFSVPVPSLEGRVSLGIFDARGRLVRVLARAEPVGALNAGLDGLVFEWDGRDDAGAPAGGGPWTARGWFVPDRTRSRGEAFHFNDWAEEESAAPPSEVLGLVALEGDRFAMAGRLPGACGLAVWEFGGALLPRVFYEGASEYLAGSEQGLVCWKAADGRVWWFPLFGGGGLALDALSHPPAAAAGPASLWILPPGADFARRLLPEPDTAAAPSEARFLAASKTGVFFGGAGKLWRAARGHPPVEIPTPGGWTLWSMSAGPGDTLWVAGSSKEGPHVRQVDFSGEILRELRLDPEVTTARIFADQQRLRIFVMEERGARQRVLGLEHTEAGTESSGAGGWEIFLDRSITRFRDFGFQNGRVVPERGGPPHKTFRARLSPSHWQREPGHLEARLEAASDGLWVADSPGLPLVKVCEPPPDRFTCEWSPASSSLRVLAARPAVVEEFVVENLGKILPLDAGEIGARQ